MLCARTPTGERTYARAFTSQDECLEAWIDWRFTTTGTENRQGLVERQPWASLYLQRSVVFISTDRHDRDLAPTVGTGPPIYCA